MDAVGDSLAAAGPARCARTGLAGELAKRAGEFALLLRLLLPPLALELRAGARCAT